MYTCDGGREVGELVAVEVEGLQLREGSDVVWQRLELVVVQEQHLIRGLVFKAHRLLYHSTLGLRIIKKKNKTWRASSLPRDSRGMCWRSFEDILRLLLYYSQA